MQKPAELGLVSDVVNVHIQDGCDRRALGCLHRPSLIFPNSTTPIFDRDEQMGNDSSGIKALTMSAIYFKAFSSILCGVWKKVLRDNTWSAGILTLASGTSGCDRKDLGGGPLELSGASEED